MKLYNLFVCSAILLLTPVLVFSASEEIIFNAEVIQQDTAITWQIFNVISDDLLLDERGVTLQSNGDLYIVYPKSFNYKDYDTLSITLSSDQELELTVIPNVEKGLNTFELKSFIDNPNEVKNLSFSLRMPFFKDDVTDIGLNFRSDMPTAITISEIKLSKKATSDLLIQGIKDYWRVAPYSGFSVNLFPTPRIFGHSALIYFLPLIFLLLLLLFFNKKFSLLAGALLLGFWVLTDVRMGYEFFKHKQIDYQSYVLPPVTEKKLRNYGNFYQFADLVRGFNLTRSVPTPSINFYFNGSGHLPRILQYQIYPVQVNTEQMESNFFVVYNNPEIKFSSDDRRLYNKDTAISQPGEIVAEFNDHSFIFIQDLNVN